MQNYVKNKCENLVNIYKSWFYTIYFTKTVVIFRQKCYNRFDTLEQIVRIANRSLHGRMEIAMGNIDLINTASDFEETKFTKAKKRMAIKAVSRCHYGVFIYILISALLIIAIETAAIFIMGEEAAASFMSNTTVLMALQVLVMYVICYPIFAITVRKLPKADRFKSSMPFGEFLALFCIGTALMLIGSLISNTVTGIISDVVGYDIANATSDLILDTPIEIIILVVVVIGPIFEELIFRKAFIDRLSIYGDRFAVVISSFAFGLFHGNLSQLIYATALGFLFGYIYTKTRKISLSILMHMMLNFFGTIPSVLIMDNAERIAEINPEAIIDDAQAFAYMQDALPVIAVTLIQYGLAFIGIIMLVKFIFDKEHRIPRECDVKIPFYHLPRVAIFNIGTILFIVLCTLEILASLLPTL